MTIEIARSFRKPDCPEHDIKTINDLYQVATNDNIDKLFQELRRTFEVIMSIECTNNFDLRLKDPERKDTKLKITQFKWKDD